MPDNKPSHVRAKVSSPTLREAQVLLLAVVLLAITYYHGQPRFVPEYLRFFWWVGLNLVLLLGVPLAVIHFVWRERVADYGLALGHYRIWSRWFAVLLGFMLPIIVLASRLPSLQAFYPRYPWAKESALLFAASSAAWFVYFLAWEFFFRGFLLFTLLRRHAPILAVTIQTVPFVMMHFPKPEVEAFASIIAGVALGFMAYRSRSVLGPWLLHWFCAFLLDILVVTWPTS
jgi:membrane protease YdiL (CAAX protease family)